VCVCVCVCVCVYMCMCVFLILPHVLMATPHVLRCCKFQRPSIVITLILLKLRALHFSLRQNRQVNVVLEILGSDIV